MEKTYKTTPAKRTQTKLHYEKRRAEEGEVFLAERRARRKELRAIHKELGLPPPKRAKTKNWTVGRLLIKARKRGRAAGLEATIRKEDLHWPTHCPVLGLELDYSTPKGLRDIMGDRGARPSIDRWDNSKGYVPGNCYVISYRANSLKGNATAEELRAIAEYAEHGLLIL